MAKQANRGAAWAARLDGIRFQQTNADEFADLLESVESQWRGAVQVQPTTGKVWFLPSGDSLNKGSKLEVRRTRSGYVMEISVNPGWTRSNRVVQRRATLENAPTIMNSLLGTLLEGRSVRGASSPESDWPGMVARMRAYGRALGAKADLLAPLALKWSSICEISDKGGEEFGIIRRGDRADDGKAVWITPTGEGWSLRLSSQGPRKESSVTKEVRVSPQDVGRMLDELLTEMTAGFSVSNLDAQQVYRALLRDFVGPWLRKRGYRGSGGHYHQTFGDYQVEIRFQKSVWSTHESIDYLLNLSVRHLATAALYDQANREATQLGYEWEAAPAGSWHRQFPGNFGIQKSSWVTLRPGDDIAGHADHLFGDLDLAVFPEVEIQLRLPLATPTPPERRPVRPSHEEMNRSALASTVTSLRSAGARVDDPDDLRK
jgi:hypothetical protein